MQHTADVAVVGAGHAGLEAALASARMGAKTVLFTLNLDSLANLPCNPSIGGSGKGHLVYEIDALGGEMGRAADLVTLQSRTLNLGKGAAVHSKRIQADRTAYRNLMKHTGYGLCHAIRFASLNPARMLGIEDRVGSLEVGKDGDVVIWTADPMTTVGAESYTTIIDGKIVYQA